MTRRRQTQVQFAARYSSVKAELLAEFGERVMEFRLDRARNRIVEPVLTRHARHRAQSQDFRQHGDT